MNEQIKNTLKNLKKNNFQAEFFENREAAVDFCLELLKNAGSISRGGSVTLEEINLIGRIAENKLPFQDYFSKDERKKSVQAEYYLSGSNAITEEGEIINVDGAGNRIAALAYGPDKIIIVAGTNKIVKNREEGILRIKNIAAPLNARRLNKKTPCVKTLKCEDCSSEERICRKLQILEKPEKGRITVVLINEKLGF